MEKRKVEFKKYADAFETKTIKGLDGTEISVRTHIPYETKEEMAREMVMYTAIVHDDSCIYVSNEIDKIRRFLIVKYYTDIDVNIDDTNGISDYLINNNMMDELERIIDDDMRYVSEIYWRLYTALTTTYSDDRSLTKAIRTSFSFLFTGEDITESLAKAEAMKDTVYGAINAFKNLEKEQSENINNGSLKIGGNIIKFAKKPE